LSKYDYERGVAITRAFGRTDYMYMYEVAPWAYKTVEDRIKVAIEESIALDAAISNWPADYPDAAVLTKLTAGIPVTNFPADYPDAAVLTKLTAGIPVTNFPADYPDAAVLTKLTAGIPVTNFPADYPDAAVLAKLAGGLPSALSTDALKVREQNPLTSIDVSDDATRLLGEVDNLKKWGGTALTGRDISLDLAKLDVALSTKARLQPWYQPNFTTSNVQYTGFNIGPHAVTTRWTYTAPASRIGRVLASSITVFRVSAATTLADAGAQLLVNGVADIPIIFEKDNTVGARAIVPLGESSILKAGETLQAETYDSSTGGTHHMYLAANIMEYDT
jgi:hypothetical protein